MNDANSPEPKIHHVYFTSDCNMKTVTYRYSLAKSIFLEPVSA